MFYRTQIKSVTGSVVVDKDGKNLQFMGYLPVKASDWVFTDGKFIFGNVPPRGSPAVFAEVQSGIPVLCDYDSSGEDELRGYFTNRGKFKKYRVNAKNWLVNDDKNFKHDEGNNIILDAEISADGALLTVEKKVTRIAEDDNDPTLFYYYYSDYYFAWQPQRYFIMMDLESHSCGIITHVVSHSAWWTMTDTSACDYIKNQTPIIIQGAYDSHTGTQILPQFIDKGDDAIIRDCELTIKKDGEEIATLRLSKLVEPAEQAAMDYVNVTVPNMSFKEYIKSRAKLLNLKITPDGKWTALFLIEIGAERDYPNPDGNVYEKIADRRAWLEILGYSSAAVHSLFMFKVDSDGNTENLAEKSEFMPLWLINNIRRNAVILRTPDHYWQDDYPVPVPFTRNRTTFPYEDYKLVRASSGWNGDNVWSEHEYTLFTVYDSRLMPDAPDYDNGVEEFNDFYFPVQDDYRAKITNCDEEIDKWQFGGIIDADNKRIIGALDTYEKDAHKWNMSCASLKGGGCLFGIHKDDDREIEGALYKIDDKGTVEQVGDGLKNFRLRELKNISKARR